MSLTKLCLENIADNVNKLPPLLKDKVIIKCEKKIKEEAKKELKEEVINDLKNKLSSDMCLTLPYLVPEIMNDIIRTMTTHQGIRKNYYNEYNNIPKYIIDVAIQISENTVIKMEDYYVIRSFEVNNREREYRNSFSRRNNFSRRNRNVNTNINIFRRNNLQGSHYGSDYESDYGSHYGSEYESDYVNDFNIF